MIAWNNNTYQNTFDNHIAHTVYTDGQSFDFLRMPSRVTKPGDNTPLR